MSKKATTLEEVFSKTKYDQKEILWDGLKVTKHTPETPEGVTTYHHKDIKLVGILGDLEQLGKTIEILNILSPHDVVRRITIAEKVSIDVMDGSQPISFPKNTSVYYEAWFMDRGSYLIYVDEFQVWGKLATEYDTVKVIE